MENLVNYLQQTSSNDSVNKTTTRSSVVHSCRKYAYVGFSRRKIPRSRRVARWQHRQGRLQSSVACTISEKAIQFRHLDYDPDRTQKLTSRPCRDICRHATFHPNPCTLFWVISLTNRQTNTGKTCTFVGGNKWANVCWTCLQFSLVLLDYFSVLSTLTVVAKVPHTSHSPQTRTQTVSAWLLWMCILFLDTFSIFICHISRHLFPTANLSLTEALIN